MVRLSHHAQKRMAQRGITLEEIERVLQDPHTTYDDVDGKPCYVGDVDGRRIKVVVAPDDRNFVVTAIVQS
jgi:hypothetical protein